MNHLKGLNPQQYEAATTLDQNLLILAGAGSGKTRVITSRIAHLIQDHHVDPSNILAVTFTNKAAKEMKERVSSMLKTDLSNLMIRTFHSFAVQILRKEINHLGYKRNFVIYDESECLGLIRRIIKEDYPNAGGGYKAMKFMISNAKNQLLSPKKAHEEEPDSLFPYVYQEYQHRMKLLNAVDFDDLLIKIIELLVSKPEVREKYQKRFRYIMVDEYQDTNDTQLLMLKKLYNEDNNICVVGDDDQSIYAWRGANINHILNFENYFSPAKVIKLEQNYRSTETILNASHGVICKNRNRKAKKLWSDKGAGDPIRGYIALNDEDEAKFVTAQVVTLIRDLYVPASEVAVLYRSNRQSKPFEMTMRKRQIPYRVLGGKELFDRAEVKDIVAYLKLMVNPFDEINLLRVINVPQRGIGRTSIEKIKELAHQYEKNIWQIILKLEQYDELKMQDRIKSKWIQFRMFILKYHSLFKNDPVKMADTLDKMIKDLNYYAYLEKVYASGNPESKELNNRLENVQFLRNGLDQYSKESKDPQLSDFLSNIAIDDFKKGKRKKDELSQISLMTIHSSKGLEFDYVFLVGFEEGILPHKNSVESGDIAEERRLCYVAITRARKKLFLTYRKKKKFYGTEVDVQVSPFFDDIPEDLIRFTDLDEKALQGMSLLERFQKEFCD